MYVVKYDRALIRFSIICKSTVRCAWNRLSSNYKVHLTADILCQAAESAVKPFSYIQTVLERKKMFKDFSWDLEGKRKFTRTP